MRFVIAFRALFFTALLLFSGTTDPCRADKASEPESIVFLHYWTNNTNMGATNIVHAFNQAHSEFQVRVSGFEYENFKVGIKIILGGDNPPDIVAYWIGSQFQSLADSGLLVPLDRVWRDAGLEQAFSPAMAKTCEYNGIKYAIPVCQHYICFFYNKNVFRKLNLSPPTTWDEFMAAAQTIRDAGITPFALGSRARWPAQFWFDYLLLRTAGPEFRSRLMAGEASYMDPETETAFALWKQLLDNGWFTESPGMHDWPDAAKMVLNGEAAMTLMATWITTLYENQLGAVPGKDYDFFPFPVIDPDVPTCSLGLLEVLLMSEKARARRGEAAPGEAFLTFFAGTDPQAEISRSLGALPASLLVDESTYSDMKRRIRKTFEATEHQALLYDQATPPEVSAIGLESMVRFLENPSEYRLILRETQQTAEQAFHRLQSGENGRNSSP